MDKLERLYPYIEKLESVLVCYSGGTDSTLLLYLSQKVLGNRAEAVFFESVILPEQDKLDAIDLANVMGAKLHLKYIDMLGIPELAFNPQNRCYLCKKNTLSQAKTLAGELGLKNIVEGSHADDLKMHRPGRLAIQELGALSPFEAAGIGKEEIREISKKMGLSTWQKLSFSCLMTRLPHGERVLAADLKRVELGEKMLRGLGFKLFRLRHKGDTARLELGQSESTEFLNQHKEMITDFLKAQGYAAVEFAEYTPH